jgi:hypothetical protein
VFYVTPKINHVDAKKEKVYATKGDFDEWIGSYISIYYNSLQSVSFKMIVH